MCAGGAGPALLDEERAFFLDDFGPTQGQHECESFQGDIETGDPGVDPLGTSHHSSRLDVVLGAMPGADQAPVIIDGPVGQVGIEVTTAPGHRKELAVYVPNGVSARTLHGPGSQLGYGPDLYFMCHDFNLTAEPTDRDASCAALRHPATRRPIKTD